MLPLVGISPRFDLPGLRAFNLRYQCLNNYKCASHLVVCASLRLKSVSPFGSQANVELRTRRPLALRPNLAAGLPLSRMISQQARVCSTTLAP